MVKLVIPHIDLLFMPNSLLSYENVTQSSRVRGAELFKGDISEAVELI